MEEKRFFQRKNLKAVLFDMDGVLFNSMPYHAEAWSTALQYFGLDFKKEEAFLHEGRTGAGTINIVANRQWGRNATPKEIDAIYAKKSELFNQYPSPQRIPGALDFLCMIKKEGLLPILVTGSGQRSLFSRLDSSYHGMFQPRYMITAFDVKHGKPNPEPYLMGLQKGNIKANEAVVIENAPLGVQSATEAGIYTIAVNTGPLSPQTLTQAGADRVFSSMEELLNKWDLL